MNWNPHFSTSTVALSLPGLAILSKRLVNINELSIYFLDISSNCPLTFWDSLWIIVFRVTRLACCA